MLIPVLLGLTGSVLPVLLVLIAYAAWVAHKMTLMERVPVDGHPSQVDLNWADVSFPSGGDRVPLSGWYLPAARATEHHRNSPRDKCSASGKRPG